MELKPCPFCGGEAAAHNRKYKTGVDYVQVKCARCSAMSMDIPASVEYCAKEVAAEAWNRRAGEGEEPT